MVDRRLAGRRFCRLTLGERGSNPEYRIADDVRMAIDPLIDFAIGLLTASISGSTFIGILRGVGGGSAVGGLRIPAYMVVAALLYGTLASAATLYVGRTLPRRVAEMNEAEAPLRFALTRLRENAEAVALSGGTEDERRAAHARLAELVDRRGAVVRQSGRLTRIVNGNAVLVPVVTLLSTTPEHLAGSLSLGAVVQLATTFLQVQVAIAWLVENWRALADWLASARRVVELVDAPEASPPTGAPSGPPARRRGPLLAIERLVLEDASGRPAARIHRALELCGLARLAGRLDRVERWDRLLPAGERRAAAARPRPGAPARPRPFGPRRGARLARRFRGGGPPRRAVRGAARRGPPPARPAGRPRPALRPRGPTRARGRGCGPARRAAGAAPALGSRRPRRERPMSLADYDDVWDLELAVCPCDQHFLDWIAARDLRGVRIFHFGTGNHHLVEFRSAEDGRGNAVLGITASPREHESYVKLVIARPEIGRR